MTNLICKWCRKGFEIKIGKDKEGDRNIVICPNCGRTLPSSKKVKAESVNRKHIHEEWKNGEVI